MEHKGLLKDVLSCGSVRFGGRGLVQQPFKSHSSRGVLAGALLLALTLSLVAAACSSPEGSSSTESTPSTTNTTFPSTHTTGASGPAPTLVAMSELARLTPAASQAEMDAAAASVKLLGVDLYKALVAANADANIVFSPSSIETALTMTYAGAAGKTAQEMAGALHLTLEGDALHQAFNSLDEALEARSFKQTDSDGTERSVVIKTANSLWGQKDLTFEKVFLDTLAKNYGAGIRLVDYKQAAEAARQAINKWVSDETNGKIPELLQQGVLDAVTRLVLVNAVYLNASWASPFDKEATQEGEFTTLAGQKVTAQMMSQTEPFPYAKGQGWQAIELPYAGNQLAMTLVVPDQDRFVDVESTLENGLLDQVVRALDAGVQQGSSVALTMPRFKFRTQTNLNEALAALGMQTAFTDQADFSGMTKQEKLCISDVIHEAYIAVDEDGTEAAAATAVIMRLTAAPGGEPAKLKIDRPFLFAIRDRETGAVMFLGRVLDPTA